MGEKTLDLRYYKGEDLYSDGSVEDELLEITDRYTRDEYNDVIYQRSLWAVLYHLSQIRENILCWYPFKEDQDVLEIGSGCGALTGIVAKKVRSLTCVELSKKRSEINLSRNRDLDNIHILVGNYEDIEPEGLGQYDVITLMGVLEYAAYYIHSSQPYLDLLRSAARHLKPGGCILLAIENRLGLKYWAGCSEDHLQSAYYEGLEGYQKDQKIRTFSKKELEQLISETGCFKTRFYYPHPDYKLPGQLFTEDRLPVKGELRHNRKRNFDQRRLTSFNEDLVYDTLAANDLYPQFANSFFVEIRAPKQEEMENSLQSRVLYARFANERCAEYAIQTLICSDADNIKFIWKRPLHQQAKKHIENLYSHYEKLNQQFSGSVISINRCEPYQDGMRFEYINTETTLAEVLQQAVSSRQLRQVMTLITSYANDLREVCKKKTFVRSEKFQEIFGDIDIPVNEIDVFEGICDVDLTFDNILINGDEKVIIDYEWTFDMDIPLFFVLWRAVYLFLLGRKDEETRNLRNQIYEALGLTDEERICSCRMEAAFQQYVSQGYHTLDDMFEHINPGYIDARGVILREAAGDNPDGLPKAILEYGKVKNQLEMMKRSTSWKITKPLRKIMDQVRGIKHENEDEIG